VDSKNLFLEISKKTKNSLNDFLQSVFQKYNIFFLNTIILLSIYLSIYQLFICCLFLLGLVESLALLSARPVNDFMDIQINFLF